MYKFLVLTLTKYFLMQMLKEFARIKGKDVVTKCRRRWTDMEEGLISASKSAMSVAMKKALEPLGDFETMNGMC